MNKPNEVVKGQSTCPRSHGFSAEGPTRVGTHLCVLSTHSNIPCQPNGWQKHRSGRESWCIGCLVSTLVFSVLALNELKKESEKKERKEKNKNKSVCGFWWRIKANFSRKYKRAASCSPRSNSVSCFLYKCWEISMLDPWIPCISLPITFCELCVTPSLPWEPRSPPRTSLNYSSIVENKTAQWQRWMYCKVKSIITETKWKQIKKMIICVRHPSLSGCFLGVSE